MALSYISCLLEKRWIVSLVICYSEYILHIIGYQVAKFDCAGVSVSRGIRFQPSPSQRALVNAFGQGVMTSQNMNCRGSLPPTDCVSLYKTYIGCILHILSFNDANVGGQYSLLWVDIKVQPCESGVSLYTRNRAPAWCRVTPSEIDLSSYLCFDLDTLSICSGNKWQNLVALRVFAWQM